jgi:hypothetical protein
MDRIARVVAPDCDTTLGTTGNSLAVAACGWCIDDLDFTAQQLNAFSFDKRIDDKGASRFSLTPAAVAAMHDHRVRYHAIANLAAGATAVVRSHFSGVQD